AALAAIETQLSNLPHQLKRAEARLELARFTREMYGQLSTRQATAQIDFEQARKEYEAANAEVAELNQRKPALEKQQTALRRQVDAAGKRLELKTDEQQALQEARARVLAAGSRRKQAQVAVDE